MNNYLEYYSLQLAPFANSPDQRFYFQSHQHEEALIRLRHAIEGMRGLAVLVGEVGTGKSTLARKLLQELDAEQYQAALLIILHSDISPEWLLRKVAAQLGVAEVPEKKELLLAAIFNRLLELHQQNKKAVILVDEANMLHSQELLEEFRGLLNLELSDTKLLTFILFGLPDLDEYLSADRPLRQRMAVRFTLHALGPSATRSYVEHRLAVAGRATPLFSEEAFKTIYRHSQGIPRLINNITDNALLEGFLRKAPTIDGNIIEDVAIGLGL